jgi:hypothetical protein
MFAYSKALGFATIQHCVLLAPLDLKPGGASFRASNGKAAMQTQSAMAPITLTAPATHALFHQFWPPVVVACGLGLTAAWTGLLGYGLVSLIALAF